MSARFTETEKWSDPWFQSLPHGAKLLFMYLCDRCNSAGFYEENVRETCFHLGIDNTQYSGALKALERGIKGASGWFWIKNFLRHQKNKDLNPNNPAHIRIIRLLQDQLERFEEVSEFRGFIAPIMGLLSPLGNIEGNTEERVKREKQKFTRPTKDELIAEMKVKGVRDSETEAQKFLDHFNSNGWKIGGKAAMKDWKASVGTWSRNNGIRQQPAKSLPTAADIRKEQDRLVALEEERLRKNGHAD